MKKTILTFSLLIFAGFAFAGNGKYEQKMGETLGKFAECKSPDDFRAVANQFLLIGKAEKKEWLPFYYHAHALIIMSFMAPREDAEARDALLDESDESVSKALELAPGEAEVHALNAFYLIARLSVDPASRGQQYSMMSQVAIGKAMGLDAKNPRVRYIKLSNDMGTARFFRKDVAPYCEQAGQLLADWDDFKPASRIHPSWGKAQVQEIIADCESAKSE